MLLILKKKYTYSVASLLFLLLPEQAGFFIPMALGVRLYM